MAEPVERDDRLRDDLLHRLDAIERVAAHQERTIEDLNAALTAQWRKLDAMARELARLADRMQEESRREPGEPEPPPPHY